jgi:hypothetical protein
VNLSNAHPQRRGFTGECLAIHGRSSATVRPAVITCNNAIHDVPGFPPARE